MEYALFLGFAKIGIYPNYEEAKEAINGAGIWNICAVKPNNGKLTIINRETVVINPTKNLQL